MAERDLPQPGTPTSRMPRGDLSPFSRSRLRFSAVKRRRFSSSQFRSPVSPPTSRTLSSTVIFSSPEMSEKRRSFAVRTSSMSSRRMDFFAMSAAMTFSASMAVTPQRMDAASRMSASVHSIVISPR